MNDVFLWPTVVTLLVSLIFGLVGLVLAVITIKLIDHFIYREIDFMEEIARGNMAAAIFAAALLLFVAIILGNALR